MTSQLVHKRYIKRWIKQGEGKSLMTRCSHPIPWTSLLAPLSHLVEGWYDHKTPRIKTLRRFFRVTGKENNKGIERPCIYIGCIFHFTVCFFPDSKVLFHIQNDQSFDDWCLFRILTKEMYFPDLWGFAVLAPTIKESISRFNWLEMFKIPVKSLGCAN